MIKENKLSIGWYIFGCLFIGLIFGIIIGYYIGVNDISWYLTKDEGIIKLCSLIN